MKKDIIIVAVIAVLFVLIAGIILANFTFYKEYKDKVDSLDQQSQTDKAKMEGLEAKFDNFKSSIDDITSQIKTYSDSVKTIQNTVSLSEEERKNLLSRIEEMKKDLQGIQKDYASTIIDIKQSMMSLKDELDKIDIKAKPVELGKITVKPEEKKEEVVPSVKQEGANFKSGNVRKVGVF